MLKQSLNFKAVYYATAMVAAMWLGFVLQKTGIVSGCDGAIIPLHPDGLKGVFFSPFLHGNIDHIFGNSVPVFVLIFLLFQFYGRIAGTIFFTGWFVSSFLVWLLPPVDVYTGEYYSVCIIGASGIVYVLAFFLFFCVLFCWNLSVVSVSLCV